MSGSSWCISDQNIDCDILLMQSFDSYSINMDLKISFLSVIRVISFRKCFFTQVLNLCIRGGQLFNISNRFYITLDTVLSINLIKWYLKDCLHVIRIRSSCRKCDSCLSYIDGVKFYVPIGITKLLSACILFAFRSLI